MSGGGELTPIDRELGLRNRRLIAERTGWPEGAVETCEAIEAVHPAWVAYWRHENTRRGFEAPAGFYATPRGDIRDAPTAYGLDAEAVSEAIETRSSDCPVCGAHLPVPPGSRPPDHRDGSAWCQVRWTQTTRPAGGSRQRSPEIF